MTKPDDWADELAALNAATPDGFVRRTGWSNLYSVPAIHAGLDWDLDLLLRGEPEDGDDGDATS
jgi:hypothetical protein